MREYLQETEDVLSEVKSDEKSGLSADEASARLERDGLNKLKEAEKTPLIVRFFQQMADPMIIMLIVAAAISAATGIAKGEADFADVIIIMFVVILNSVLGVVQESKAEEALSALQEMSAAMSKVVRDGKIVTLPSAELVVGDVILLEAGDAVPADCRLLEAASLKIEEAALTGESVPADKVVAALSVPEGTDDVPLGDRKNMCYMGSVVVYGRGRAVVVATGMDTEMGKIADALSQAADEETPLQKKLTELSKILTLLVVGISVVIFLTGFIKYGGAFLSDITLVLDTFMVAVSLAVAAIPEGLAAVVTIVLSMGVTKMSEKNAIIRKLSAVETLGCTQIICSDKTGTLTQNKMTVVRHFTWDQSRLVRTMALCSDAKWDSVAEVAVGEPTEAALVADAAKIGFTTTDLDAANPRVGEAPFDSGRKMMSVVNQAPDGNYIQHTKGGPDVVLARCTKIRTKEGDVPLTDEWREKVMEQNKAMADDALRVMAAARVNYGKTAPTDFSPEALEHDMTFIGLCGMIDPVRPEVKDAIEEAHSAGIRVVMITGDHIDTAVAIARELGVVRDASQAITGADLDKISDDELVEAVERFGVYARVQPEHKTRIVDAWKRRDKVVAMTGDGVNDAPSIKRADIGIGMGITGTDVTKNVADMVLADDNFATIIHACEEGRRIYDNIRKCIQFLLSSNLAEVISVFVASLVGFTILEPTHLLWINLITDSLPALAMATEGAEPGIMKRKPRDSRDGIFSGGLGVDTLVQGVIIAALTLLSYFIGHYLEFGTFDISQVLADPKAGIHGMTMAFLTLSMVEMFHSLNMRSRRESIFRLKKQNLWLWGSFVVALILTFVVIETPLSHAFGFAEISIREYAIAMGLAFVIIPIVEIEKAIMRAVEKGKYPMAKRSRKQGRRRDAGRAPEALPALSSLIDLPTPGELSPSEAQRAEFEAERDRLASQEGVDPSEVELACVVRLDRGFPAVLGEKSVTRCEFSAALTKGSDNSNVAVGDWVVARHPAGHDMGLLCKILTRESDVARWKGGSRGKKQTLAANVDTVLVVQPLGAREVFFERVVRSAVIARDCGAEVSVVLTKADRVSEEELARDIDLIHEAIGSSVHVVVMAAAPEDGADVAALERVALEHGARWGEDGARSLVPEGECAIVLGESGAGKSTMLNALLGHEALETGAVRDSDDAGRHTTVARRMVSLPGAGIVVDEPGLRSLPLVGHERGLAKVFPEIADAALDCRFRDCTHTHEPGCEVRRRFEAGEYSQVRFDAYVALAAEMRESATSLDPDVVL